MDYNYILWLLVDIDKFDYDITCQLRFINKKLMEFINKKFNDKGLSALKNLPNFLPYKKYYINPNMYYKEKYLPRNKYYLAYMIYKKIGFGQEPSEYAKEILSRYDRCFDCGRYNFLRKSSACVLYYLLSYDCCRKLVCHDYCIYYCNICKKSVKSYCFDGWHDPCEKCGNTFNFDWNGISLIEVKRRDY